MTRHGDRELQDHKDVASIQEWGHASNHELHGLANIVSESLKNPNCLGMALAGADTAEWDDITETYLAALDAERGR